MTKTHDRRSGPDRRQQELGPPGPVERRRRVEQRKLEVEEIAISESEWQQLFLPRQATPLSTADSPPPAPSISPRLAEGSA